MRVSGGRKEDRRTFATALYHSLLEPSVTVGCQRPLSRRGPRGPPGRPGHAHYSDISGWDVYCSQIQLLAMIEPRRVADIAASLLRMEKQGGCPAALALRDRRTR